jgi:hypothetical protein
MVSFLLKFFKKYEKRNLVSFCLLLGSFAIVINSNCFAEELNSTDEILNQALKQSVARQEALCKDELVRYKILGKTMKFDLILHQRLEQHLPD